MFNVTSPNITTTTTNCTNSTFMDGTSRAEVTGFSFFAVLDSPGIMNIFWVFPLVSVIPTALVMKHYINRRHSWPNLTRVWPILPIISGLTGWLMPLALLFEMLLGGLTHKLGMSKLEGHVFIFCTASIFNTQLQYLTSILVLYASDPATFDSAISLSPFALSATTINLIMMNSLSPWNFNFWVAILVIKGFPLVKSMPFGAIREARNDPTGYSYRTRFFKQFPWESIRSRVINIQISECAIFLYLMVPMVTTHLREGVGPRGKPYGYVSCKNSSVPLGEEFFKYCVIFFCFSLFNVLQFVLLRRGSEWFSREMENFRPPEEGKREEEKNNAKLHVLPWPNEKIRSAKEILNSSGWRLFFYIFTFMPYLGFMLVEITGQEGCNNMPKQESGDFFITSMTGGLVNFS